MKSIILFSMLISTSIFFSYAANAGIESSYTCTKNEIKTIYIPILREVVDWPDDMIRPYAVQLCQLTKEKMALQKSIQKKAKDTRQNNWRICKEVIPGNPTPTDLECKIAYNLQVNNIIDSCLEFVNLGHNPHNVGLILDPANVEVTCLRGVDKMFL